jgi:hypothetical protein
MTSIGLLSEENAKATPSELNSEKVGWLGCGCGLLFAAFLLVPPVVVLRWALHDDATRVQKRRHAKAVALFAKANDLIKAHNVSEAKDVLKQCVQVAARDDCLHSAVALLAEVEAAVSDDAAYAAIVAMNEADLESQIKKKWELSDGRVNHPVLVAIRKETLQRAYAKLAMEREQQREQQRNQQALREQAEKRRLRTQIAVLETRIQEYSKRTLTKAAPGVQDHILTKVMEWSSRSLTAKDQSLVHEIIKREKRGRQIEELCQAACSGDQAATVYALSKCTSDVLSLLDRMIDATDYGRVWANEQASIGEALVLAFAINLAEMKASLQSATP